MSGLEELTREELIELVLKLHGTVKAQQAEIGELKATVQHQAERIAELEEEIARLRGGKWSAGLCIKPGVAPKEKGPRKKRKDSFARGRVAATRVIYHAVERCPDCGRKLSGISEKWRHQVVELGPVRAEVTDHVFVERRCGVCGKRFTPDAREVLAEVAVGKKNIGIGVMSLIAHLKTVCRMPIGQIRKLLSTLFGVKISAGEIAEILHDVARMGQREYDGLLDRIRGSPVLHGDETGWREDGVNGYLWSFSTPQVRYYTYRRSRGSVVVKEVLGKEFAGTLVSDFYAAYNIYDGIKQRCWIHLLRDLKLLVEKNEDMPDVSAWVDSVVELYERAKEAAKGEYKDYERSRLRLMFEEDLLMLCRPYVKVQSAPERVLAERMVRFLGELFIFVQCPDVPSENNPAERAIRPAVVARKISGGTRSPKGSKTSSVLRTLFETWTPRGCNALDTCRQMLIDYNNRPAQSAAA